MDKTGDIKGLLSLCVKGLNAESNIEVDDICSVIRIVESMLEEVLEKIDTIIE